MFMTIVLRKEVATVAAAQALANIVKDKIADQPEIKISASVSEILITEEV